MTDTRDMNEHENTQNSNDNAEDTMNKGTLDNTENVDDSKVEAVADDTANDDAVAGDSAAESNEEDVNNLPFNFVFDDAASADAAADEENKTEESGEAADNLSSVAADNAMKVNETLALQRSDDTVKSTAEGDKKPVSNEVTDAAATSVSTRLDREIRGSRRFALKSNPTLALDHVTISNAETGRAVLDDVSMAFHKGNTYAVLIAQGDLEMRQALLGVTLGMIMPTSGNVISKSVNLHELEPLEVLAHRIGFIPQQYAVRADMDAENNLLYAMDASNRNFLKPKPVIARELLKKVGFDAVTSGVAVGTMSALDQYRVAVARALVCEADVIIADEPTAAFEDDAEAAETVLKLLAGLKRDADGKRCIIIVTDRESVASAMETTYEL